MKHSKSTNGKKPAKSSATNKSKLNASASQPTSNAINKTPTLFMGMLAPKIAIRPNMPQGSHHLIFR